jgi:hypothetical protein
MLRRQISNRSAWCFAFFWAVWPYFAGVAVSGMENAAMIALIALAAGSCAAKSSWSGPAIAAVACIRPEGLASATVLALFARARDRWIAAGLVGAALVALALYFGSPVPQSLIAKSQVYGTSGPWTGRFWWDWLLPFVLGRFPFVSDTGHLFLIAPLMGPAVWFGARALWAERRKPVAAFVAACVVVWLGYSLLGVAYFWWYLAVPLVGLAALAAIGFPLIVRGPAIYAGVALLVLGLWTVIPKLYIGRSQTELIAFGGVAKYLAEYARPGQKVLLEPIGMVGYGAPVYVIDEIGLVSPEVARRRTRGAGWYADVLRRENPDWLVVRRSFLTGGRAFAGAGAPFRDVGERTASLSGYYLTASVDSSAKDTTLMVLARRP